MGRKFFPGGEAGKRWLLSAIAAVAVAYAMSTAQTGRIRSLAPGHAGIVLTQLPAPNPLKKLPAVAGGMLRSNYGEGARILLLSPNGERRVLTEGFHSAADPEVSFDGKRILFAAKKNASDDWNIYEMQADGSRVRQITRGLGDCRSPVYQSSLFVLDSEKPWYQAAFASVAAGELNEYAAIPSTNLYSVKLDGSAVRRLTFNPSSSLDPYMLPDGRLLFAGWQRAVLDRGPLGRIALFGINLDGTDFAVFSADEGPRIKHMPCVTTERLVVFVEADRLPWDGAGHLASVSLRRNLHSYRRITAEKDGLFHSPSALPDGTILVSRRPNDSTGTHAVYRLDPATGRLELIFDDPAYHNIQAKILYPRAEPDGHSSVVDEKDPTGKFYCLSVGAADVAMPEGAAKRLRVLEGLPRKVKSAPLQKRFLGEINLEADGSFNIQVPANIPIQLQVLDGRGMALRSSSWIWVKNREARGCIGCHEDGERTPENALARALTHPSIALTLPPERRRTVDFRREVEPILSRRCNNQACHGGAVPPLDLDKNVHPGKARTSPLVWRVFGASTSRPWDPIPATGKTLPMPPPGSPPLTEEEKRTIIEWIDLGAYREGQR